MNLEDFKSFCRVLKPSEVGSIPTHSRQAGFVMAVLLGLSFASRVSAESQEGTEPAPAEETEDPARVLGDQAGGSTSDGSAEWTTPVSDEAAARALWWEGPGPMNRATRSVCFPAFGQLTNGKKWKTAAIFGLQSYLLSRVVIETREGHAAQRRLDEIESADPSDPALGPARTTAEDHFNRRRNLLFWAIVTAFFGAIDAYIDFHLADFDEDLEEGRRIFSRVDFAGQAPGGFLEMELRF